MCVKARIQQTGWREGEDTRGQRRRPGRVDDGLCMGKRRSLRIIHERMTKPIGYNPSQEAHTREGHRVQEMSIGMIMKQTKHGNVQKYL